MIHGHQDNHKSVFKSLHLIPLPNLPSAFETAELIFNHVFGYFNIVEDLESDNSAYFT